MSQRFERRFSVWKLQKVSFFALFSIVLNFLEGQTHMCFIKTSANKTFETRRLFYFFESMAKSPRKVSKIGKNDKYGQNVEFENCEFRAKRDVKKRNLVPQFPRAKREA